MKTRRIEVADRQLNHLADDLRNLPTSPPGECLSDEQFVAFMLNTLSADEVHRFDEHIEACRPCAEMLEHLLGEYEARAKPTLTVPANLIAVIFGPALKSWLDFVRQPLPLAAARVSAEGQVLWEWHGPDGITGVHAVLEPNGDLVFRFASTDLALAGHRVRFRTASRTYEAMMEKVSAGEVGAKIQIPREDRPAELADLHLEFD